MAGRLQGARQDAQLQPRGREPQRHAPRVRAPHQGAGGMGGHRAGRAPRTSGHAHGRGAPVSGCGGQCCGWSE
eukprot:3672-Eustigmatos_ZCMA.PRE.1